MNGNTRDFDFGREVSIENPTMTTTPRNHAKDDSSSHSSIHDSNHSTSTDRSTDVATSPLSAPSPLSPGARANNDMDDVWGSPQASPSQIHDDPQNEAVAYSTGHGESSELPSLKRTNHTLGYRAGISDGKNKPETAQMGFDEGYPVGAGVGLRVGWILGILTELKGLYSRKGDQNVEDVEGLETQAAMELSLEAVMGEMEQLGLLKGEDIKDRVWTPGNEWLGRLSRLQTWMQRVNELATKKSIVMPERIQA